MIEAAIGAIGRAKAKGNDVDRALELDEDGMAVEPFVAMADCASIALSALVKLQRVNEGMLGEAGRLMSEAGSERDRRRMAEHVAQLTKQIKKVEDSLFALAEVECDSVKWSRAIAARIRAGS